jgi:amino acid transporter
MGVMDIVFTVLAYNAPMSVFVGFITVIIGYGSGLGAPVTYIGTGCVMLLFAVGFTVMGRQLPNPGAFYAYITAGLGRPLGLGSAFVAITSYLFMLVGGYTFGGLALQSLVHDSFGGPSLHWWVYVLGVMAIVAVLGYFNISLSAKILTVFMCLETIVMVTYDTVVFIRGGAHGIHFDSFRPAEALSGNLGLAFIFAITCFAGFEATAIFREEAKDPQRTIPKATYSAVLILMGLYSVTAWAMIIGIGASEVVAASNADPTGTALETAGVYLTHVGLDVVTVLLVTSIFAANLAGHNIATRYLYSLSIDGIFPRALSTVHRVHVSPYRASIVISAISYVALAACIVFKGNAATLYASLIGIAGYALIMLLALTSVAVAVYNRRHPQESVNAWRSTVAPILSAVLLSGALVLATKNVAIMIGGSQELAELLVGLFVALLAVGIGVALILRRTRPTVYQRIGRQDV